MGVSALSLLFKTPSQREFAMVCGHLLYMNKDDFENNSIAPLNNRYFIFIPQDDDF